MPPASEYAASQIRIHWAMMVLITLQFLLSYSVLPGWHYLITTNDFFFTPGVIAHVVIGTLVLALVIWRLVMRLRHPVVTEIEGFDPWLEKLSHLVHLCAYAVMIAIPLTGLVAYFGDLIPMSVVHNVLALGLLGLIGVHASGALYHQFIRHDGLLMRMVKSETSEQ
jgi:cytochrome b561